MYLLKVYVTNNSLNVNHPFTYLSLNEVEVFKRVQVKFHNSFNIALVVESTYSDKTSLELSNEFGYKLLFIESVIDETPIITLEQYKLANWLSKTTISPFITCLNSMLPKTLKTSLNTNSPKMVSRIKKNKPSDAFTKRQLEVYEIIYDGMLTSEARKISASIVNKLLQNGSISEIIEENKYINEEIEPTSFKELTKDQYNAYQAIIDTDKMVSLLFGVTGSGKTEVYLHLAKYYLSLGKEILILVPEISLTPQMIQRVKQRFHDVVFYHSELNDQERYEQYKRIKMKEVKIVVGTRSSIFLPFNDLGLIIIDEEHDSSYKQDNVPMYHVKNVAIKRAIDFNAKVLLASATPSLESYSRAIKQDYQLVKLEKRINLQVPEIELIDLNKQIKNQSSYIISKPLQDAIENTLNKNKQTIILLNRRGYSPIVKCVECNTTLMCQDCDIPLSYHKDENILKCHQCGKTYHTYNTCPKCGNHSLIYYGFGTKKVEEELNRIFPNAITERMDRDNVTKKGAHKKILDAFERKEIDILVGTQMLAKGLDYPDVTLVGILNADAGLMHQDYNSSKLTFDLLMQASGRSGRALEPGRVLIQAFNPDHYAIKAVLKQDYNYFYNIEMNYRQKTNYPPYSHIVEVLVSDMNMERLNRSVKFIESRVNKLSYKKYKPYFLTKIKKMERARIMIMDKNLVNMLNDITKIVNEYISLDNKSNIKIDVDPLYLE